MHSYRVSGSVDPISKEALMPMVLNIQKKTSIKPLVGIICGSGLGGLADLVDDPTFISYKDIPGFPVSTAPGHKGRLVFGQLDGVSVVLMQGRLHSYEGIPLWQCTLPVRVMKLLGIQIIMVTNAVGGINQSFKVGDIMLVKDHLNLFTFGGDSPLRGPNDEDFGPRFFSVNSLYGENLRNLAKEAAKELSMEGSVKEGILTITGGPNFESIAELKLFQMAGADAVGMSNIPECLVAHHCGIKVLSFSLITNMCSVDYGSHGCPIQEPNAEEVLEVGEKCTEKLSNFVKNIIQKIKLSYVLD